MTERCQQKTKNKSSKIHSAIFWFGVVGKRVDHGNSQARESRSFFFSASALFSVATEPGLIKETPVFSVFSFVKLDTL